MIAMPQLEGFPEQGGTELLPYRRLLAATLYQATLDYASARVGISKDDHKPDAAEEFREIHDWFFSEDEDPMTYAWICDMLKIPRHVIRNQLHARWREIQRRPPSNATW